MKTAQYHIIRSWVLLVCFIAGQYMVYAHQHIITTTVKAHSISKNVSQHTITEKCSLCDVMHHNAMVTNNQVYFNPLKVIAHVYKSFEYNFANIQLILSGGRAPPIQV